MGLQIWIMEVQSRRLRTAASRGDMRTCIDARNAGGAVTFVPQDDPDGKSTLHVAAEGNSFEVVEWLLREGANADLLDAMGRTALHGACADGTANAVRAMVQGGIALDTPDAVENWTGLHFAAAYNHVACVQLMLAGGANPNAEDKWGRSPSYIASQRGNIAVVAELVDASANVELPTKDGATAFDFPKSEKVVAALNNGLGSNAQRAVTL